MQREQARCLIAIAAQEVSSRQMHVFVLHAVDGLTHVEIGEDLKVSESTSQKCFQRTRDKLAECLSDELRCAIPPFATGCDEPASSSVGHSRWHERSHYAGQVAATILAFLVFIPLSQTLQMRASMSGEIRTEASMQNAVMYREDKQMVVHDEPMVYRDAPSVKPEPVSLPIVRAVTVPAKVEDKPAPSRPRAQVPSFIYTAQPSANRPGNQR
jgi:predicted DNA-binding protein (UPF0251 family)